MPPKAILNRCATLNPHGFGFATKDKIYKTLSCEEFFKAIKEIPRTETAILHFRFATHGSIKIENCHPFKDEKSGISFAHNGVLDIQTKDDMTDSETAFKRIFVPILRKHGISSPQLFCSIAEIRGNSRFAFIDKNGDYQLSGTFKQHKGCWYSNRNFLPYSSSYSLYAR